MNEYDKGFEAGLAASEFTDGYWLRCYTGQAMQSIISELSFVYGSSKSPDDLIPQYEKIAVLAVNQAKALLEEVKRVENERVKHEP